MSILEVKNLRVAYSNTEVLSKVSFNVNKSDYTGIVGPNGSGKTTLIKALLGLIPFTGTVSFFKDPNFQNISRRHIGYLPQKMSFLDKHFPATVLEIVLSGVYCCKKFPKRLLKSDYESAYEAMELLNISDLKYKHIGKLSGGQQQRVLLARALVHYPEILILDEPTVALDAQSRESFYTSIKELNEKNKTTILLVSHDIASIGNYASKLLYIDKTIIFYGTFDEFCKSEKMTEYFGKSQHIFCHRH